MGVRGSGPQYSKGPAFQGWESGGKKGRFPESFQENGQPLSGSATGVKDAGHKGGKNCGAIRKNRTSQPCVHKYPRKGGGGGKQQEDPRILYNTEEKKTS